MKKKTGKIVEFLSSDGKTKKGILYDNDQQQGRIEFGKGLLTLLDENLKKTNEPKIVISLDKLKTIGFVD